MFGIVASVEKSILADSLKIDDKPSVEQKEEGVKKPYESQLIELLYEKANRKTGAIFLYSSLPNHHKRNGCQQDGCCVFSTTY